MEELLELLKVHYEKSCDVSTYVKAFLAGREIVIIFSEVQGLFLVLARKSCNVRVCVWLLPR